MVKSGSAPKAATQPAQGTYRSLPDLKIDGEPAPKALLEDILQIVVEESIHVPCMFTLVIQNDYFSGKGEKPWRYKNLLQIGKTVKIGFHSSTTSAKDFAEKLEGQVIEGEITAIETHFTEKSQAPIIVRGYDTCHRLHRGQYNRSFQNMTDSDIVKKIAEETGLPIGTLDSSGEPHDYVFQQNQTNMQFLRERAARIGFELFNQDGKLHFRKPKSDQVLNLTWLKDMTSFRVRVTSAEQVQSVEVRGWDYGDKKAIVSTAQSDRIITRTENGKGASTSNKFNNKPTNPKRIVVDQPVFSRKEADAIAQTVCNEIAGQFVYADAKAEGNPEIRPGRVVDLKEMGPYDGKYYITETRHVYAQRVYITEFSVWGLRSGDLLSTLASQAKPQPGQTLLVGIVTDNNDPKGWGRVKVKFPTLTEDHASNWARVVSLGAGNDRGFDCLPEVNDEVLVAFEHGDIHRPYVIGGVWNGKDDPPTPVKDSVQRGKVRLRTFKTRAGHQIQFVDEDKGRSQAGVRIDTKNGHQIYLNDSDGSILISSTGNMTIEAKGQMDIKASSINMKAIGNINASATRIGMQANANFDASAAIVGIRASGIASLSGSVLKLN